MGYRKRAKEFRLRFADPEFEGLEIRMRGLSVREYLDLTEAWSETGSQDNLNAVLRVAAKKIVSWNLEDEDGEPVPVTVEGLQSLEMEFISRVITAWMEAMVAVASPLPPSSNGSGTILPGSIPMETLSPSLAS